MAYRPEVIERTNEALIEVRRFTSVGNPRGKLQQIELIVVPFRYGPRCYMNALEKAGLVLRKKAGGYTNKLVGAKNWTTAYVTPCSKGSAAAIKRKNEWLDVNFPYIRRIQLSEGTPQ